METPFAPTDGRRGVGGDGIHPALPWSWFAAPCPRPQLTARSPVPPPFRSCLRAQCYVTVYDTPVLRVDGVPFPAGSTTDNDGATRECVTFIVLLPPKTILHAATLTSPAAEIDSDVQDWNRHPAPEDEHPLALAFPLGGDGPWLCTQGEGGELTHFFSGNLHAVDFRCDVGTPLLAVGPGTVVEVSDENTLTGIAVSNLFKWNSVMIQIDAAEGDAAARVAESEREGASEVGGGGKVWGGPLYVEYVHIKAGSACVKIGDRVTAGQKICESGSVGFSPEPHLHFTAFRSREPTAPTTRVRFRVDAPAGGDGEGRGGGGGGAYVPQAGKWYDAGGEKPAPGS